jgi:hypothetical protein
MTVALSAQRPVHSLVLAIAAAALLLQACTVAATPSERVPVPGSGSATATAPSIGPTAEPSVDLTGLDEATVIAIRIRTSYGLPADLETIRRAAADPTATDEFGTPLFPTEIQVLWARNDRSDRILSIIQGYVATHAAVSGGLRIDQAAGGIVTLSFTDDLDQHRRALADLLAGRGVVAVVQARYSERDLRDYQERVTADAAWFRSIGAALTGVGYSATENVLSIEVSSKNPDVEQLVIARYNLPGDAVKVESDGTGAHLLPSGTVRGRVLTAAGKAPGPNEFMVDSRGGDPGWCGGGDIGVGVQADGSFEISCKVGRRTIVILARPVADNGEWTVVGQGSVVVPAGGVVRVTIHLDPPA